MLKAMILQKQYKEYLSDVTEQNVESVSEIAKNSLGQDELFLTNGFKLVFSQKFAKLIVDWFTNKFMVIYRADSMQLIKRFADPKKRQFMWKRQRIKPQNYLESTQMQQVML